MVKRLLEDSDKARYWAGFISADGCLINKTRLRLSLSAKDKGHLLKFSRFIGKPLKERVSKVKGKAYPQVDVAVQEKDIIPAFAKMYGIKCRKSTNPPLLDDLPVGDAFTSYAIGFIDGDGCVGHQYKRSDFSLRIKCHSSWVFVLQRLMDHICGLLNFKPPKARVNNQGYAEVAVSAYPVLRRLREEADKRRLPYLKRKLGCIDINRKSKYEVAAENLEMMERLLSEGYRKVDIARVLKVSKAAVTQYSKKLDKRKEVHDVR